MLSKCSNPTCSTPFPYLHEGGRLFLLEYDSEQSASASSRVFLAVRALLVCDDPASVGADEAVVSSNPSADPRCP